MKIQCPNCGQRYELTGEYGGQEIECPQCHQMFTVEATQRATAEPINDTLKSQPSNPNLFFCPDCGKQYSRRAAACPHCGAPNHTSTNEEAQKSEIVFVLLALLLGGIGIHNFYANEKLLGTIKIIITLIGLRLVSSPFDHGVYLGMIFIFVNMIWCIVDIVRNRKHLAHRLPQSGLFNFGVLAVLIITLLTVCFYHVTSSTGLGYYESCLDEYYSYRIESLGATGSKLEELLKESDKWLDRATKAREPLESNPPIFSVRRKIYQIYEIKSESFDRAFKTWIEFIKQRLEQLDSIDGR